MGRLKKTASGGLKTKIVFCFKNNVCSLKQLSECLKSMQ